MTKIREIARMIEEYAPLVLQEDYDNAGLIIGNPEQEVKGVLITLDVTDEVIDEAIENHCNLIVAHHPLIFGGVKKINPKNPVGRMILSAVKNDIAVYAAHTNLDNVSNGVNAMISQKLGLINTSVLQPKEKMLKKLVTFCPVDFAPKVREAIFRAGAGHIGKYDDCSFNTTGEGTFRAQEGAKPFVGAVGEVHFEPEVRIETVFPGFLQNRIVSAMLKAHPYEEVAYDVYSLDNHYENTGAGMIGELPVPETPSEFLKRMKTVFQAGCIRHTKICKDKIKKVALCGGTGSFLLHDAIALSADIFITADVKYHEFFNADNRIIIADVGHYESEQFTKELLMNLIKKKFSTFAVRFSEVNTNPIGYFC